MQQNKYCVQYIGEDTSNLRNGEYYVAEDLKDTNSFIGVLDRYGEWYAYPKELFQKVYRDENSERN